MKVLILIFSFFLFSAPNIFSQDSLPDWVISTPEINGMMSFVGSGEGTLQALTSALRNISESIESEILFDDYELMDGGVVISESAVKWGDIYIFTNTYSDVKETDQSYKSDFISKTYVLFEREAGKIEFYLKSFEKQDNDEHLYNSEFQLIADNIGENSLINELYALDAEITFESTLTDGYVLLQIPENSFPDAMSKSERDAFKKRADQVMENGLSVD